MAPVLEARDIVKDFAVERPLHEHLRHPSRIRALDRVDLRIDSGEIVGLIGPNGAGKTTLMRVLADVLEPDAGWVKIGGERTTGGRHRVRRQIGYVSSDERSFFWRLTGWQNLAFFAALYGIPRKDARVRIEEILDMLGIRSKARQPFRDYSSGTRKKFALARALIHKPRVVLLDEVTNSLDPPSARKVKKLVRDYVCEQQGRIGLWSTHRYEEIGEICDRVIAIEHGGVGSCNIGSDVFKQANVRPFLNNSRTSFLRSEWQDAIR